MDGSVRAFQAVEIGPSSHMRPIIRPEPNVGCAAVAKVGELHGDDATLLSTHSAGAVSVGFEGADFFEQGVELRCVVGDDGGGAHGVVVGSQAGKLVVVGDEPQPAVKAVIVVGVTGVEKHPLVPDDILEELAVGESGAADMVCGEAGQIEPVPREPFGMFGETAPCSTRHGPAWPSPRKCVAERGRSRLRWDSRGRGSGRPCRG